MLDAQRKITGQNSGILSLEDFKEIFNTALLKYFDSYSGKLKEPISDLIRAGGKRIRPYIVYLCSLREKKEPWQKTLLIGLIPELIHTASLVHDDIIDNAKMRRGHPTIHSKWNTRIAILSGDFIFSLVLKTISMIENNLPQLIEEVVKTIEDMIEGQAIEDEARNSQTLPDLQTLKTINELKTGSLFSLSFYLGTTIWHEWNENSDVIDKAKEAGKLFGSLFQIYDDLLDIFGKMETIKKDPLNDLKEGKITIPYVIACQKNEQFHDLLKRYMTNNDPQLLGDIRKGVIKYSVNTILRETNDSLEEFKDIVKELYPHSYENLSLLLDNLYAKITGLFPPEDH